MRYSGLLWNSVAGYAPEILSIISKDYNIERVRLFNVENCLDNFVRDIYVGDSIADWKVNKKIDCLQSFPNRKITVFDMDIPNPVFEYVDVKKRDTCVQVERLKKAIRGTYSQKIQPYFFDMIIHISDDQRENILMQKVLYKYNYCCESEMQYNQATRRNIEIFSKMDVLRQKEGR